MQIKALSSLALNGHLPCLIAEVSLGVLEGLVLLIGLVIIVVLSRLALGSAPAHVKGRSLSGLRVFGLRAAADGVTHYLRE